MPFRSVNPLYKNINKYIILTKNLKTREGFLRKIIVVVSFFSKLYTHILNTYLFHSMKSFMHEHLFHLYKFTYIVILSAQTDLGLRSRSLHF